MSRVRRKAAAQEEGRVAPEQGRKEGSRAGRVKGGEGAGLEELRAAKEQGRSRA